MKHLVTTFEAKYGREGKMWIDPDGKCDQCLKYVPVICIDSSLDRYDTIEDSGEYGHGCICLECIQKAFARNGGYDEQVST